MRNVTWEKIEDKKYANDYTSRYMTFSNMLHLRIGLHQYPFPTNTEEVGRKLKADSTPENQVEKIFWLPYQTFINFMSKHPCTVSQNECQ